MPTRTSGAGGAIGKFSEQKEAAVTSKRRTQGSQYDQLTIQDTQRIVLYRSLNPNRTKSTKLNLESSWIGTNLTEPNLIQANPSIKEIQSFKSQAKKQHRISLPYYYHLHSLSKIFSQGPRIGRIHPNSSTIDQINACETNPGRLNSQT